MASNELATGDGLAAPEVHKTQMTPALIGMFLFIASEIMFFGALFASYFTLRSQAPSWPPPGVKPLDPKIAFALLVILLTSSVTLQFGIWGLRQGNVRRLIRLLYVTIALGLLFEIGQAYDYWSLVTKDHTTYHSGTFGALFFTMTGFHGGHVLGGLGFLIIVLLRTRKGQFTPKHHDTVEMASWYWHFVDVVWVGLVSVWYVVR